MNVLTNGCDYKHLLEKRPDFLLAGEFSEFGKSQGCGEEYKTREIDADPLLTQETVWNCCMTMIMMNLHQFLKN